MTLITIIKIDYDRVTSLGIDNNQLAVFQPVVNARGTLIV